MGMGCGPVGSFQAVYREQGGYRVEEGKKMALLRAHWWVSYSC
jgi:hypothetical protein